MNDLSFLFLQLIESEFESKSRPTNHLIDREKLLCLKMAEIPKISITQDFASDDESECSAAAANINEAHTDIEDLDSDEKGNRNQFPSGQLLNARKKVKTKRIDDCATDIEDCEGSGSDEDLVMCCDAQLSLTEFLDQGNIEETSAVDGGNKTKQSRKGKRVSLIVPADDSGAVTDCEDLSSDNEISIVECQDNPTYDNFLLENDDFSSVNVDNSAFVQTTQKKRLIASKRVDNSESESDDDDNALARRNWNELSDVENVALSDQEDEPPISYPNRMKHSASALDAEEMIMVASDNECVYAKDEPAPEIAVSFVTKRPKKTHSRAHASKSKNSLAVHGNAAEEGVTDVENLDSSDDDGPNVRKSLAIPIAYVSRKGSKILTDVEDFDVDDECIASTSADIKLPSPVREICVMREDSHGDPVAKVMPLVVSSNGSFLGIDEDYIDKGLLNLRYLNLNFFFFNFELDSIYISQQKKYLLGLTDTEDLSGNEDEYDSGIRYEIVEVPNLDGGVVMSADGLMTFTRDRKSAEFEQLTDIEEIRMHNTHKLRRKRSKPKGAKTKDGLLAVGGGDDDQVLTENEELYVDDDQIGKFSNVRFLTTTDPQRQEHEAGVTDTEDFSGDEDILRKYSVEIDPNVFQNRVQQQQAFFSTITSSDGTNGNSAARPGYSKISTTIKTREANESSADLSLTDVEDVDLVQSEADELLAVENVSRGTTPNLLRNTFNEFASSRVYDQAKSEFDVSNEADHIKNYADIQTSHTDTEMLE